MVSKSYPPYKATWEDSRTLHPSLLKRFRADAAAEGHNLREKVIFLKEYTKDKEVQKLGLVEHMWSL